jgi:predicted AlkP superfamily pyrophosphatase or phosphodiesterase
MKNTPLVISDPWGNDPLWKLSPVITLLICLCFAAVSGRAQTSPKSAAPAARPSVLIAVFDGLRPDYITAEVMPNVHALEKAGAVARRHHAVFPTMTRVASASIATGSHPGAHGLMYNALYLPEISARPLPASSADALFKVDEATGGQLLTAPSLGELLHRRGKKLLVAGSCSTGTALLSNHKMAGGILASQGLVRPESLQARALELLGPFPPDAIPSRERNRWAVDAVLKIGLDEIKPDVILLWLTEPDNTAHKHGVGTPQTLEAVRHADEEFGRLLKGLESRGFRDQLNILVTSDHGFSTHGGGLNIERLLKDNGLEKGVTVVGTQIFVSDRDENTIRKIVGRFQENEPVGAIFTRAKQPGAEQGFVPGTLSFDLIRWNHPRSADILISANWDARKNKAGYSGTTTRSGIAGHGTTSPFELQVPLIASGPQMKRNLQSQVPSGNIDIAPTVLHLLGIEPPSSMHGRVMTELLRTGPAPETVLVKTNVHRTATAIADGRYELELTKLSVGNTDYLHSTSVRRTKKEN